MESQQESIPVFLSMQSPFPTHAGIEAFQTRIHLGQRHGEDRKHSHHLFRCRWSLTILSHCAFAIAINWLAPNSGGERGKDESGYGRFVFREVTCKLLLAYSG